MNKKIIRRIKNIQVFQENNKLGFLDELGNIIVSNNYDEIIEFPNFLLCLIHKEKTSIYVDIINYAFFTVSSFKCFYTNYVKLAKEHQGYYIITDSGKRTGFISDYGNIILPAGFCDISYDIKTNYYHAFRNIYKVSNRWPYSHEIIDKKEYVFNQKGEQLRPLNSRFITYTHKDYSIVEDAIFTSFPYEYQYNDFWTGKEIVSQNVMTLYLTVSLGHDTLYGLCHEFGEISIPCRYTTITKLNDYIIDAQKEKVHDIYNLKKNKLIISNCKSVSICDNEYLLINHIAIYNFNGDCILTKNNGCLEFINKNCIIYNSSATHSNNKYNYLKWNTFAGYYSSILDIDGNEQFKIKGYASGLHIGKKVFIEAERCDIYDYIDNYYGYMKDIYSTDGQLVYRGDKYILESHNVSKKDNKGNTTIVTVYILKKYVTLNINHILCDEWEVDSIEREYRIYDYSYIDENGETIIPFGTYSTMYIFEEKSDEANNSVIIACKTHNNETERYCISLDGKSKWKIDESEIDLYHTNCPQEYGDDNDWGQDAELDYMIGQGNLNIFD